VSKNFCLKGQRSNLNNPAGQFVKLPGFILKQPFLWPENSRKSFLKKYEKSG